jgi:hypothetical protein
MKFLVIIGNVRVAGAAMQYNCPFCNENLKDWMKIQSYDSSENGELEMNCDILLPK